MSDDASPKVHPHDVGLPRSVVRKRLRFRHIGYWMLLVAVLTAIPGWSLYGLSVAQALASRSQPPWWAIMAYALLIVSSITLVLGLWYLLLAQVRRIARVVHGEEIADEEIRCPNCGWTCDYPDRFCRHCGKPLGAIMRPGAAVSAPTAAARRML